MRTESKLLLLGILNAIDWLLTVHAIELGATEINPLISKFVEEPEKFTVIKLGIGCGAIITIASVMPQTGTYRRIGEYLLNFLLILYGVIVISNTVQLIIYYMVYK